MQNVIFIPSYDRPILLDYLLNSLSKYIIGDYDVVIYLRTNNDSHKIYYDDIKRKYNVKYILQQTNNQTELFPILKYLCKNYKFISLFVDDYFLYDYVNIDEISKLLIDDKIISYSYRLSNILGKNSTILFDTFSYNYIDDFYLCDYGKIISHYNTTNMDNENSIKHFTYPFEVSSSMYYCENLNYILDNINKISNIHSLEYYGRLFVVNNINKTILMKSTAQSIGVEWNNTMNDFKFMEKDEIEQYQKNSYCKNFKELDRIGIVEKLNDCFVTKNNYFVDNFYDIIKNIIFF